MNGKIIFWKSIDGFEGTYIINNLGIVYNRQSGKFIEGTVDKCTGYVKVNLYYGGKNNMFLLHRLVALAFIPNPDNLPHVHHKDGDKQNNHVENLEWVSRKEHGGKMTDEQKQAFRNTYRKNLEKRKKIQKSNGM